MVYTGKTNSKSGIEKIMYEMIKTKVVEVIRISDKTVGVQLVLEASLMSVVDVYIPQYKIRKTDKKDAFSHGMNQVL